MSFLDGKRSPWIWSRLQVRPYRDGEGVFAEVEALGVGDDQLTAIRDTQTLCEDECEYKDECEDEGLNCTRATRWLLGGGEPLFFQTNRSAIVEGQTHLAILAASC